jgi:DNA-binding response OmpR family regulator
MSNLILLIGDDDRADRPLKLALARMAPQFRVELVNSRAGIEALRTPSVILLDLKLSREPAFELLRWLRTDHRYKPVPVFALAPHTDDVTNAYALGANSCLLRQPSQGLEPIAQGIAAYASLLAKPAPGSAAWANATV